MIALINCRAIRQCPDSYMVSHQVNYCLVISLQFSQPAQRNQER
jgi:hypothetical protein